MIRLTHISFSFGAKLQLFDNDLEAQGGLFILSFSADTQEQTFNQSKHFGKKQHILDVKRDACKN